MSRRRIISVARALARHRPMWYKCGVQTLSRRGPAQAHSTTQTAGDFDEIVTRPRRRARPLACLWRDRADQVGLADGLSADELPHREHRPVRRRRGQGDGRQAQDHRASERLAVQGQRDQARGARQPGAGGRNPAGELRERRCLLRTRRRPLSGDELRRRDETLQGREERRWKTSSTSKGSSCCTRWHGRRRASMPTARSTASPT